MSGIAALVFADGRPVEQTMLDAMIRATPHIGIDGAPSWHDGPAGLVRFALATTPEAVGQDRPWIDEASSRVVAFDGRIDNREEVRTLLGADAPRIDAPDAAYVLAAYGKLGDAFLNRLAGDYGFAIWDPAARRMFCARSPVGWRPLLWTFDGSRFAVATEPASLVRGLDLPRKPNLGAIGEHLSNRFVTATDTFWEGVQRVPPGSAIAFENGNVRLWRWNEGPFEDLTGVSQAEHVERFLALYDQALVAANRADRPVSAALSGGLDSSSNVCRIHDLVGQGRIAAMPGTVSARYPGEICDEGEWIEAVEQRCGIAGDTVHGAPFDAQAAAEWSAASLHLPLRPNTAGTTVAVARWAQARGSRVVLTGEGGDDWMDGGRSHWPDLLMRGHWLSLWRQGMAAEPGRGMVHGMRSILADGLGPLVSEKRRTRSLFPHLLFDPDPPEWISRDWARQIGLAERWADAPMPPPLTRFTQRQRYGVYALSRRHVNAEPVFSWVASQGVEMRHPMHDMRLTRFLMGADGEVLRRNNVKKTLLREAMRGVLPELVRTRRTKGNISAPIIDGCTAYLAERPIRELLPVTLGWIDPAPLERYCAEHEQWRRSGDAANVPKSPFAPIWNAIAIDIWLQNAVGI